MTKLFKGTLVVAGIVFGASYAISDYRLVQQIGMTVVVSLVYVVGQLVVSAFRQSH